MPEETNSDRMKLTPEQEAKILELVGGPDGKIGRELKHWFEHGEFSPEFKAAAARGDLS